MASGASLVEISLTGFGIADQDFELQPNGIPTRRTSLATGGREDAVDVLRDRVRVALIENDLRVMLLNRLADQFAVLIVERSERAK
jgi:hypothetical protein